VAEARLQKLLAAAGLCSRRGAEEMIRRGLVSVNGEVVADQGRLVDPDTARITVAGRPLAKSEPQRYYMFHKPENYLTSMGDPFGRPTIRPFLERLDVRVYPVGRLDNDVSGVLILTNDGELGKRLMHPSYMVPKTYRARVKGEPSERELDMIRSGKLVVGDKPCAPARARMLDSGPDAGWLELTLTEGRHRQVKKMCAAVGHRVVKLKRIAYCGLRLPGTLKAGDIVELDDAQVRHLKVKVGLLPPGDSESKKTPASKNVRGTKTN
jgi:pseudouridine synthase